MARIDPLRDQLVIRLVYDGPAQAGKTTSVRALARSLGTTVFSGAEEAGRTLYFDWADYVGGLFEGMPIRCQIVSAPGQTVLERRRRRLLESADAVIFVIDSRPDRMAENLRSYAVLSSVMAHAEVAAGIVMQANKRDLPSAVSLDDLRDAFGEAISLAMTEAVAETGEGVRETFVLAVRLALDRVRLLWSQGVLEAHPPEYQSGPELLAAVVEDERREGEPFVISGVPEQQPSDAEPSPSPDRAPRPPDATIPPGLVWPPVQGRVTVHEAARHDMTLARHGEESWQGMSATGGWRISSPVPATFSDLEEGRSALVAWARWHAAALPRLSPERALVLAQSAPGEWRLWQIVRSARTLFDLCTEAVRMRGREAVERVFEIIDLRALAFDALVGSGLVDRVSLGSLAVSSNGAAVYSGDAPYPPCAPEETVRHDADFVETELLDALRSGLAHAPGQLPELLAGIEAAAVIHGRARTAQALREGLLDR